MISSNSKHIFKYKTIFKENIDVVGCAELEIYLFVVAKENACLSPEKHFIHVVF